MINYNTILSQFMINYNVIIYDKLYLYVGITLSWQHSRERSVVVTNRFVSGMAKKLFGWMCKVSGIA